MTALTIGDAVQHRSLGEGTVVEIVPRRGVKVDFGYAWEWIGEEDLEAVDQAAPFASEPLEPEPVLSGYKAPDFEKADLPPEIVRARRAILSLKLGHMLEENVGDLSVGVDDIRAQLETHVVDTAQRKPHSILVEGQWGTGKTHLLTLLTALAAKHGLATASVILDGEGIVLSEPMGLMESVLGSLRYPHETVPKGIGRRLVDLRCHVNQVRAERRLGSRLTRAIFEVPIQAFQESDVMEVLEEYLIMKLAASQAKTKLRQLGWRIPLPPLKAQRVDDRPNRLCDLLKSWAEFSSLTGAKGLVVVFDELDVEYAMTTRRPSIRLQRSRILATLSGLQSSSSPLLLAFGSAPVSEDVGEDNDAVRDVRRHFPGLTHIKAPRPSLEQTIELGRRLHSLYDDAYPDHVSGTDTLMMQRRISAFAQQHLSKLDPTPRDFVRGTLERLELAYSLEDSARNT